MEEREASVIVRGARKQYTPKGKFILDNLNMTVTKGTIYGLLGASGCGKTTLLSSIVGMRKIQSGTIRVFGEVPGRASVKSIGYMPQDIALVGEFTVKGAIQHYGWLFGMSDEDIDIRFEFLSKLLDLPPKDRMIKNLSGGQQRRVSFAVVLVHSPDLLILDEPTVGLDPVLRQKIWDYLVKIANEENKSIIITTHYIEEANNAHYIGLMRNGKILEEGSPQMLMAKYNCPSTEDVFLLLSKKQEEGYFNMNGNEPSETEELNMGYENSKNKTSKTCSLWNCLCFTNKGHAKALLGKNFLRFARHPGTLMFAFFFPILEMSIFFLAVGRTPTDLTIGIINEELGNYTDCLQYKQDNYIGGHLLEDNETCIYNGLSCRFIDQLGEKLQNRVYFKTKDEALKAAKQGKIHNLVYFPRNYSESVTNVRNSTGFVEFEDYELMFHEILVYRDVLDHSLSDIIQKELYDTYKRYAETLATDCNFNPRKERIPIRFNDPVYGNEDLTYRDLIAPGMIALISVFLTMGISASSITSERTEGVWERTIVAGVTPAEILIFHAITISCVSVIQIIELLVISFNIFELDCKGDKLTVFILVYFQAVAGICFGITISVITKTVTEANYASLGLFYPFIILTGCFWPIEGMPPILRYLSYFVPMTICSQSLSNVIHRGWGFEDFHVLKGILASIGFIFFFLAFSTIIIGRERR